MIRASATRRRPSSAVISVISRAADTAKVNKPPLLYWCEPLECRRLLSTINWVNRGDGTDSFDTVFGANDDLARAVVDAALDAWERLIVDFNQDTNPGAGVTNPNTLNVTLSMAAGTPGFGGGAGNPATYDVDGTPLSRGITISSGQDTNADGNGDGVGWYLDPNPNDHSEFAGPIFNAFVGQATVGGAADNLNDLYSLVTIEMNHALGLTNFGSTPAWTGNPFITNIGVADSIDTPGALWTFSGGPSGVTALLTSNNGGPGGTNTAGPLHVALPGQSNAGIPAGFSGALDVGNASGTGFPNDLRFLPSLLSSMMLSDVYGYTLAAGGADVFGTMHALFNTTTGNVLVRGMTGNNNSNDIINISRSGGQLVVSVDVGADVAGTGPTGPLESRFNIGSVSSITLNGLDGNDTITFSGDLSFLTGGIAVTGDGGNDTLTLDFGSGNPVPASGLTFDGGTEAGSDLLVLQNGTFASETYTATGSQAGTIALTGGFNITYSNLAPIDDTLAITNFTFNGTGLGDVVEIENSPVAGRSRIRSSNGTFELLDYADKTNITINGLGGSDTFNLTATVVPPGLSTLAVNGGAVGDTFNVSTTIVPTTLGGDDGADQVNINDTSAALTVNGGNNGDVVSVNDTGNGSTVVVNGDAGSDTIVVNDTGAGSSLTVNGNGDADSIDVTGTGSTVVVNGGDGGDTVNLLGNGPGTSLIVNGNNDDDSINATGAGLALGSAVQLNGNADDDTFDVTSSPLVAIPVNGGGDDDTLKVNGQTLIYALTTVAGVTTFSTPGRQNVTSVQVELLDVRNGDFTAVNTVVPNVRVQGIEDGAATLRGVGVIVGSLTVDTSGTVAPGIAGPGILGSGNLQFVGGAYAAEINGTTPGTLHDQLNVTGAVNLGAGVATLAATVSYGTIPGDEIVIVRNDGFDAVAGFFAGAPQGAVYDFGGGQKFTIDYAFDADGNAAFNDVALIRYGAQLAPDPCDPSQTALFVSATAADDVIRIVPATGNARGRVLINGVDEGVFRWDGYVYVMGQNGDDTISVEMPSRKSFIYGQAGNDELYAGNNDAILIGGFGDDDLWSGNGKDILIGSDGADRLHAGNGTDVLIAGATTYDGTTAANRHTLCHAAEEWKRGGKPSSISGVFNAASLINDNQVDQLFSGNGKDWLILNTTGGGTLDVSDADKEDAVTDLV